MFIHPPSLVLTTLLSLSIAACSSSTPQISVDETKSVEEEEGSSTNDDKESESSVTQESLDETSESSESGEDSVSPSEEESTDKPSGEESDSSSSTDESGDSKTSNDDDSEETSSGEETTSSETESDNDADSTPTESGESDSEETDSEASDSGETDSASEESGSDNNPIRCADAGKNPTVKMETNFGTMLIKLDGERAPNTVTNFIRYIDKFFYNGTIFHRIIDDFMIQGGGYDSSGKLKETKDPIDLEIHEELRHINGAISMARTMDPNSAASQFFICDGAQTGLDDEYAAFGVLIEGFDVLQTIASTPTGAMDAPEEEVIIDKAYCLNN